MQKGFSMNDSNSDRPDHPPANQPPQVVVQIPDQNRSRWMFRIVLALLIFSLMYNLQFAARQEAYYSAGGSIQEKFHSGSRLAQQRIVRIEVSGTIMPPFTDNVLRMIKQARDDDNVRGVLLLVNSPGGLVTDSHQIYHELTKLSAVKPVYVSMGAMAASGGLYISMGAGTDARIFAEPTTWTGSIGVIIPRYNIQELASKLGISAESIKTGPLKDSLSPFRDLSEEDLRVWTEIIEEGFDRFKEIIAQNRKMLAREDVDRLATGQIYTARQAKENGLIDEIGFEQDALEALAASLGLPLDDVRVVTYKGPPSLLDILGGNVAAQSPAEQWRDWMELTVPRAMYYCSWLPAMPGAR
jgi:protease IV